MHKQSVDIRYFSNYPNNLLYFFFELFVFKLNKYFSIFSDSQQALCVITVNCALYTLSCLLVYKTAAQLTRKLYAFFGFFLAVLSFGLSPWNVICYTDALGLIFPILTLYVFIRPAKYKWLSYVLSAIIGTLGYFIKPQCFILLIAVFLIEGIYALSEKHLLKPLLLSLLTVAITFFAVKAGTDFLCSHYHIQLDNEQSFGIAHFWMMGLNPEKKGVYSAEDGGVWLHAGQKRRQHHHEEPHGLLHRCRGLHLPGLRPAGESQLHFKLVQKTSATNKKKFLKLL